MPSLDDFAKLNSKWLGYRYVVASTELSLDGLGLSTLGITEIDFPVMSVQYTTIPSLSTVEQKIPSKITFSNMVLRAPVVRNSIFFKKIDGAAKALRGQPNEPFNLIIAEFDATGAALSTAVPIVIWTATGCLATSFSTPSADANFQGGVPLESLTLKVDNFYRPTI